jgi:hypothetical protein
MRGEGLPAVAGRDSRRLQSVLVWAGDGDDFISGGGAITTSSPAAAPTKSTQSKAPTTSLAGRAATASTATATTTPSTAGAARTASSPVGADSLDGGDHDDRVA